MAIATALMGTKVNPRRIDKDELPDEITRQIYDYEYKPGEDLEDLYLIFGFGEDFLPSTITVLRHKYKTRLVVTLESAQYSLEHGGWLCRYDVQVEAD